jgi:hypothetical protein
MKPGIYRDYDVAKYHADPCPTPSLNQSLAKVLNEQSPMHVKYLHPRLTPPETDDEVEKYVKVKAIGDAAHALMIGRGRDLAIGNGFADWRSKEAKAFRDEAEKAGKTAIIGKHYTQAVDVVNAALGQLDAHTESDCFTSGAGEVALFWKEGNLWFRCLVDWLHDNMQDVDDYKTSGMSVAEHVLGLRAVDQGWDVQAAMIERGLNNLNPLNAGTRRIRFVTQEQNPPHALNVMVMTEHWLTMGRKKLQHAIDIWSACMSRNQWPGYAPRAVYPEYPGFKETQWLNRETEGDHLATILTSIAGG